MEIANNGKLDARKSITILANIYPNGENGPIVAYDPMGNGVHLWQYEKTQLFVRFTIRGSNGNMTLQPLATRVLQVLWLVLTLIGLFVHFDSSDWLVCSFWFIRLASLTFWSIWLASLTMFQNLNVLFPEFSWNAK